MQRNSELTENERKPVALDQSMVGRLSRMDALQNQAMALEAERRRGVELQRIETKYGRDRANEVRNGPRTLDLDLLLHGDSVVNEDDLEVPHPRMEERAFVLEPLAQIAPEQVLSGCGKTVEERARELTGAGS